MEERTIKIINKLASKITHLDQPIHLLAVCTGGTMLSIKIAEYLTSKNIVAEYFEVWTNTIRGKREIWKTDFQRDKYTGTAVIVEDVIWKGGAIPPIKKMLLKMRPNKKPIVISLLDINRKADFTVFR